MAIGLRYILAGLVCIHLIAWLFVIIATAVTDWSKSTINEYGIWSYCFRGNTVTAGFCDSWKLTGNTAWGSIKDCEGALTATRAFSVLSIIFMTFLLCLSIAMLAVTSLIKKVVLLVMICMVLVTNLWLFLGWIMYLGVQARGQCAFHDYTTHLGSSWFLQLFAWIIEFLVAIPLAIWAFLKWKKTPRFVGQPPFVPGPSPYNAPAPMYPQAAYPEAPGKVPYYPPSAAPYPGYPAGPTPNTSPYVTPYW